MRYAGGKDCDACRDGAIRATLIGTSLELVAMNDKLIHEGPVCRPVQSLVAMLCTLLLAGGDTRAYAQQENPAPQQQQATPPQEAAPPQEPAPPPIPAEQLDSLVAPIALYPDPLLSQVLVASTYPLEIVQLQQWLAQNSSLKDTALTDAVMKQDWDPSIQAMATFPDVVKRLAENIKWTTDLGNAFLAQQGDVMDAVQRMRQQAQAKGALASNEQQKVETKTVENKTVVVIEQTQPQVVYVPSYNPVVVYGPPVYPYPPIYYPPPPTGAYVAASMISFGVGVAVGAAINGGWGYGCGWGHSSVNINVNNTYVNHYNRNTNINTNINRNTNISSNNTWQHNSQHRGGVPYSNNKVANQYGGTSRGSSTATRQANASQRPSQGGASQQGVQNRQAGGANAGNRAAGTPSASNRDAGTANAGNRASTMPSNRPAGSGGSSDRIGNRSVPSNTGSPNNTAFSGASSASRAQATSQRGASSMSGSRGGGGGGGGRSRGGRRYANHDRGKTHDIENTERPCGSNSFHHARSRT